MSTFEAISTANRPALFIFAFSLVPLLLLVSVVEGWSMIILGESRAFGHISKIPEGLAIKYEAAHFILDVLVTIFGAKFLINVSRSFNVPATWRQGFTTMAYGYSPVILLRLLDAIPQLNTWMCWGIGIVLSIMILYHGVGMVLRPDQTKGFGLYLFSIVFLVVFSGLAHFISRAVLKGLVWK